MIETFEGRIGGGKSYSAMLKMMRHWIKGGVVYTNLPVIWDPLPAKYDVNGKQIDAAKMGAKEYMRRTFGKIVDDRAFQRLTNEQIRLFYEHTPAGTFALPVLVVIDEAHLWLMSSQEKRADEVKRLLEFLTMSRHHHNDIIFISQNLKNLDVKIQRLNQYVWRFRDMAKWKIPALGFTFPFPYILQVCFDYDGKTQMESHFVKRQAAVFETYDSHAHHNNVARLEAEAFFAVQDAPAEKGGVVDWPLVCWGALTLLMLTLL